MSNDAIKSNQCPAGFVYIPEGTFKMGSEDGDRDEQPVRDVTVSAFCLQTTEVTNEQYSSETVPAEPVVLLEQEPQSTFQLIERNCRGEVKVLQNYPSAVPLFSGPILTKQATAEDLCGAVQEIREVKPEPKVIKRDDKHPSPEGFDGPNQPVVRVDWNDAATYCRSKGWQLPTEAQWERAAKGTSGEDEYATASGKLSRSEATYYDSDSSDNKTTDVASHKPNSFGAFDLSGNVWEWTADLYQSDAYKNLGDIDPVSTEGDTRVIRGGSWYSNNPRLLRSAVRYDFWAVSSLNDVGFRCAVPPQDSKK